ncbi:hypothetical protein LIER_05032 [Lithospermum erythrorhizon]|uniref:DOG1 domain-containing protein n=1 Tax=Lithospermum erythrorhizon TaxID=34254 RepID=A0AAV3NZ73_LITER
MDEVARIRLSELLQALTISTPNNQENNREDLLKQLVQKGMSHFEEYVEQRAQLAQKDALAYFATSWCSALEMTLLWLGGCRPSIYVRLVYAMCGLQFESQLPQLLQGNGHNFDNLGGLSSTQLSMIDNLRRRTIKEEEKITSKLASLQESIVEQPITGIAAVRTRTYEDPNLEVEDELSALRELTEIWTPSQAVDFLATRKKLHVCLHRWGQKRDQMHGRN